MICPEVTHSENTPPKQQACEFDQDLSILPCLHRINNCRGTELGQIPKWKKVHSVVLHDRDSPACGILLMKKSLRLKDTILTLLIPMKSLIVKRTSLINSKWVKRVFWGELKHRIWVHAWGGQREGLRDGLWHRQEASRLAKPLKSSESRNDVHVPVRQGRSLWQEV